MEFKNFIENIYITRQS